MNTRPTPETDKFFATFADGEATPSHAEYYVRLQDLERERDEAREKISREKIALTMFCSTLEATIDKAGRMAFKEGAAKVAREQIEAAYATADLWISYRRTNQNEL